MNVFFVTIFLIVCLLLFRLAKEPFKPGCITLQFFISTLVRFFWTGWIAAIVPGRAPEVDQWSENKIWPQSDSTAGRTANFWTEPAFFLLSLFSFRNLFGIFPNVNSDQSKSGFGSGRWAGWISRDLCCCNLVHFTNSSTDLDQIKQCGVERNQNVTLILQTTNMKRALLQASVIYHERQRRFSIFCPCFRQWSQKICIPVRFLP